MSGQTAEQRWARRLLLDSLTGGWFHDPSDLDDAQHDPLPPVSRVARTCPVEGCESKSVYASGHCRLHWRLRA